MRDFFFCFMCKTEQSDFSQSESLTLANQSGESQIFENVICGRRC